MNLTIIILIYEIIFRAKCECKEEMNSTDTKIKIEKNDLNDGFVFEGSIRNESHILELITQMNSEKTSNLKKTFIDDKANNDNDQFIQMR